MAGIYIHIPFCKQACHYCDFHFSTSLNGKSDLLKALLQEIKLQQNYLPANTVYETVYLGGGTPSLLRETELLQLFAALYETFTIAPNAEITLEANPDDLTKNKLKELSGSPVNRLSIGIQSFYDEHLKWMNRAHSAKEAEYAVKASQDAGLSNITIDLIYGVPGLNDSQWITNINKAAALQVQHLSAYCLTVEPKTALSHFIRDGKTPQLDEEQGASQFTLLQQHSKSHGYEQYEISNFCQPGYHSRHNSSYWLKKPYLGLGPSAHSFNTGERRWNISNNALYVQKINQGTPWFETETLSLNNQYNEYMMTSLRTSWGADLAHIEAHYGHDYRLNTLSKGEEHSANGNLIISENKLYLSDKGKLLADGIAADFFVLD